jgi:SagB-type dehydrogenase family enzyme
LSLEEVGQLLWAAQGVTHGEACRTAPSAGALFPLEVTAAVGAATGLEPAVYRYLPREHALLRTVPGDLRGALAAAALQQDWLAAAPVVFLMAGVYERITGKYGERGVCYTHMEVGLAGENLLLQAGTLGLGGTMVGAFREDAVRDALELHPEECPLALFPVGRLVGFG